MRRNLIRQTGPEWLIVKRSDRTNVTIKYRADPRSPWKFGSAGVPTKKEARKLAAGLVAGWLSDSDRDCNAWEAFRERYETERLAGGKPKTAEAFRTAANRLENLCPPRFVQDVDASRLSQFAAALRREGKSPETIRAYRDHLQSALAWAKAVGILQEVPEPPPLPRSIVPKKGKSLNREQAERMVLQLPAIVGEENAITWAWNLEALWRSGFRIGETFSLTWEAEHGSHYPIDLDGKRPMIAIDASAEKAGQHRLLPMAPDFAFLLRAVDASRRRGRVFRWPGKKGGEMTKKTVEKRIAEAGKKAGIVIGQTAAGKDRFATAHSFRAAFGARWAPRIMPAVLQLIMRHESIETTMKYYVGQNATRNADALWDAMKTDDGARLADALEALSSTYIHSEPVFGARLGDTPKNP